MIFNLTHAASYQGGSKVVVLPPFARIVEGSPGHPLLRCGKRCHILLDADDPQPELRRRHSRRPAAKHRTCHEASHRSSPNLAHDLNRLCVISFGVDLGDCWGRMAEDDAGGVDAEFLTQERRCAVAKLIGAP